MKRILKNLYLNSKQSRKTYFFKSFSTKDIDYTFDTRYFLSKIDEYEKKIDDKEYSKNLNDIESIKGYASEEGTHKYSQRNKEEIHSQHFRTLYNSNIKVSSLGLGTYIGSPDDITDFYVYNATKSCVLSGGINMIDTAINYRYMKAELSVGAALRTLINKYNYNRDELFISSKIGFVPEDANTGKRCHSFVQELIESNKIGIDDVIFDDKNRPVHCIHPEYLNEQINYSLKNLNLETLDLLYLHNVVETQGAAVPEELFEKRLLQAFEFLVKFLIYFFRKNKEMKEK